MAPCPAGVVPSLAWLLPFVHILSSFSDYNNLSQAPPAPHEDALLCLPRLWPAKPHTRWMIFNPHCRFSCLPRFAISSQADAFSSFSGSDSLHREAFSVLNLPYLAHTQKLYVKAQPTYLFLVVSGRSPITFLEFWHHELSSSPTYPSCPSYALTSCNKLHYVVGCRFFIDAFFSR